MGCGQSTPAAAPAADNAAAAPAPAPAASAPAPAASAPAAAPASAPAPAPAPASNMGNGISTNAVKYANNGDFKEQAQRILAIQKLNPGNRAAKHFDFDYFDTLSADQQAALLKCVNSGVCNPDSAMGCYAMNPKEYDEFKPFFANVLADYHNVEVGTQHVTNWSLEGVEGLPESGKLDIAELGLPELSMRVRVGRNLSAFPLPGAMNQDDRVNLEKEMCKAFATLIADPAYGGSYHSLTPGHENFADEAKYKELVDAHIMFKDMSADSFLVEAGIAGNWPYGRGCYVSEDKEFIVWVGEEDHLRIMCMKKGTVLNEIFDRLKTASDVLAGICAFAHSPDFGFVTSCPTNLGTGMRASLHIQLPKLTTNGDTHCVEAKKIATPLGLSVRGTGGEHTPVVNNTVDISPSARFCISEAQIITALYLGIKNLKAADDAL